jgi:predicted HicB family RNase H-like nuclease
MVNVNIGIDDELHKQIKLYCVQNGTSLKEFVNQALVEELKNEK